MIKGKRCVVLYRRFGTTSVQSSRMKDSKKDTILFFYFRAPSCKQHFTSGKMLRSCPCSKLITSPCKDIVWNGVNQHIPSLEIGGRRQDSRPGHLTPREGASVTHQTVGCVGPIANLDALGKRKIVCLYWLSNFRYSVIQSLRQSLYRLEITIYFGNGSISQACIQIKCDVKSFNFNAVRADTTERRTTSET